MTEFDQYALDRAQPPTHEDYVSNLEAERDTLRHALSKVWDLADDGAEADNVYQATDALREIKTLAMDALEGTT